MLIPFDQVQPLLKELSWAFVTHYLPDEAEFFPLIWELYVEHWVSSEDAENGTRLVCEPPNTQSRHLPQLTIGEKENHFVTPYVLLTLHGVMAELNESHIPPSITNTEKAIRCAAIAYGASAELSERLARCLAPKLQAQFQQMVEGGAIREATQTKEDEADGSKRPGAIYIDSLIGEKYSRGVESTVENLKVLKKDSSLEFDLIVDEVNREIVVRGEQKEFPPTRSIGAMLWLVLTHVNFPLPQQTMGVVFGLKDDNPQIYLYRNYLIEFLGKDLRDIVIEVAKERRYYISGSGWQFLWVRRHPHPRISELVAVYREKGRLIGVDLSHYL